MQGRCPRGPKGTILAFLSSMSVRVGLLVLAVALLACRPEGPTGVAPPEAVASVHVSPDRAELPVDGRLHLDVEVLDEEGEPLPEESVRWSSSDPQVAEVDSDGEVWGRSPGTATVTASANGIAGSSLVEVRGFLIGPSGGTVVSEDGRAALAVPSGAFSREVVTSLEPASESGLPDGSEGDGYVPGTAYRLAAWEPEDGAGPSSSLPGEAELTLRYEDASIPDDVPESSLRLRRADGDRWVLPSDGTVDTSADEVRAEVDRVAVYAAVGVPNRPPEAEIDRPADGDVFLRSQPIEFEGEGRDPEDGDLSGESLVWSSDLDGELGTGRTLRRQLSPGDHTITLAATDSFGATDQVQVQIRVLPF